MTDQPALRLVTSSNLARQLLASAEDDEPATGAMQRALSGLGFAPVGLLAATATASASKSASAAAPIAAKVSGLAAAKWVGVGMLGTLLSLGAVELARSPSPASAPAQTVSRPSPAPELATPDGSVVVPSPQPEAMPQRPRSTKIGPSAPALAPQPAALEPAPATADFEASATSADSLAQLAELASVRRAIANREHQRALSLLNEFDVRHPVSKLAEEALVLRIEALHGAGRGAESQALGASFLREHPRSVYVARVQRALEIP